MKLYVMQLLELTDRSSSIVMVQRARKNGFHFIGGFRRGELTDQVAAAFSMYSQLGKVTVRPTTSISGFSTMHEDICHIAEKKRAEMIILTFHKQWRWEGDQEIEVNSGNGWRMVNQKVLLNSPCSVAMLVDRGFGVVPQQSLGDCAITKRVCILFLGGPDSRKALELGCRMAEHPAVTVSVIRFKYGGEEETLSSKELVEKELDEAILEELDGKMEVVEKETDDVVKEALAVGQRGEFDLAIVGKGRFSPVLAVKLENVNAEYNELGYIGDLLANSGKGVKCSVLVIQQRDSTEEQKTSYSKMVNHNTTEKCIIDA